MTSSCPADGARWPGSDIFDLSDLPDLVDLPGEADWLQFGISVARPEPELYGALAAAARELLASGAVLDVFFLHKSPGLRLRCRTAPGGRAVVSGRCRQVLTGVVRDGLAADWGHAVDEAEQRSSGGPVSIRGVHRIFTADSLAWLGFHALPRPAEQPPLAAVWAMSLLMIRCLLDGLDITGRQDADVWDRIGQDGARALAGGAADEPRLRRLGQALRSGWSEPDRLAQMLPPGAPELLAEYGPAVRAAAATWLADYFSAPGAEAGPRQAAARTVILHWNRARMPRQDQALIAYLLAAAPDQP